MKTLLILFLGGIIITVGDLASGEWVKTNKKYFYALAFVFYIIGLNFLIYGYKFEEIAVASMTLEIFNVTTLTIAGRFLFKENISRLEIIGIIIGLIAVVILEIA